MERKSPADKEALDGFLRWWESITKEKYQIYLFLASAEQFFYHWIQAKLSDKFTMFQITDLPKEKAKQVYEKMCKDHKFVLKWEALYELIGI